MTEAEHGELIALRDRLHRVEARQRRRGRMTLVSIGAIAVFAFAIPVAFSAPPSPRPCSHGDLFCFGAGEPARAAEVNSNFETLHGITDALTSNVDGRLSQGGGTVTGALTANAGLTVNGGLTVAGGLPITTSGPYQLSGTHQHKTMNMVSASRSMCFLTQVNMTGGGLCWITDQSGTWVLWMSDDESSRNGMVCNAHCIQW
jgi:hypothetical protein